MIIHLPHCYPVHFNASALHWKRNGTKHGPKSNPRFFAFNFVKLGTDDKLSGWSGRRLWIYFRGGYAFCADIYIDLRHVRRICIHCGQYRKA